MRFLFHMCTQSLIHLLSANTQTNEIKSVNCENLILLFWLSFVLSFFNHYNELLSLPYNEKHEFEHISHTSFLLAHSFILS